MNKKTYESIISGKSDNDIKYLDFESLILDLGFKFKRKKGSHTMYYHKEINAFLNIQKDGSKAKAYQVRQLRDIINKHDL